MQHKHSASRTPRISLIAAGTLGVVGTVVGIMALGVLGGFTGSPATITPAHVVNVNAVDAEAIDEVIGKLYASISGPKGQPRDFDTLRAIHTDDARLTFMPPGAPEPIVMSVEGYIERAGAMLVDNGFHEREIHRELDVFGNVAHVFSTYRTTKEDDDGNEVPYFRGINSIQLVRVGGEWKVFSTLWDNESEKNTIPAQYDEHDDDGHDGDER